LGTTPFAVLEFDEGRGGFTMSIARQFLRRLVPMVAIVLIATFLLSLLMRLLPGDPAAIMVPNSPVEVRDQIAAETGLDRGVFGYYWKWLSDLLTGNFGKYYLNGGYREISTVIKDTLPVTLLLILYAQIVALCLAIPLGLTSAYKEGKRFDRITSTVMFTTVSFPGFALALIMSLIFAVKLGWVDPIGYISPTENLGEHLKLMILPVLSLAIGLSSGYTRLLRTDVIATLKDDYVTMAASKGISNRRVLWRHVFRPSSTTLLTSAALNMGGLIGGTIVIETIFVIPGIGFEIFYSIGARQVVAMQTLIALIAIGYVFFNTMVDLLTQITDPRTRERRA
jgi:peptide/nickel transport system permease protein